MKDLKIAKNMNLKKVCHFHLVVQGGDVNPLPPPWSHLLQGPGTKSLKTNAYVLLKQARSSLDSNKIPLKD